MIRENLGAMRAYLSAHRFAVGLWLLAEALVLLLFHKWYRIDDLVENEPFWYSGAYLILMAAFALLQTWQAVHLGWSFNPRRPDSWLRALPVSKGCMLTAPFALILANAAVLAVAMADFWFVDVPLHGNSVALFLVVLPVAVFVTVRRCRHLTTGAIAAGSVALALFWAYNTAFYGWQAYHSILAGELYFVAFVAIYTLLLERERRSAAVYVAAIVASVPLAIAAKSLVSPPRDFRDAVVALRYAPTRPALERLRYFVAHPEGWRDVGALPVRSSTLALDNAATAVIQRLLTAQEHEAMNRLILEHPEIFEIRMPYGNTRGVYPYAPVGPGTAALLRENWRDAPTHCFLAREALLAGLDFPVDRLLTSQCGDHAVVSWEFWYKYKPWDPGNFERAFETTILTEQASMPFGVRQKLYDQMIQRSAWRSVPQDERDLVAESLLKSGVTAERLAEWRSTYYRKELDLLRPHLESVEAFRSWLKTSDFSRRGTAGHDVYTALRLVCEQVGADCEGETLAQLNPLHLLILKVYIGLHWERAVVWHMRHQLLKSPRLAEARKLASYP